MTDTVASLGFEVSSQPLDDAKQKLGDVTTQAQKTEAQAKKTADALNKIGAGQSGDNLKKTAQSADALAASLVKASGESERNCALAQKAPLHRWGWRLNSDGSGSRSFVRTSAGNRSKPRPAELAIVIRAGWRLMHGAIRSI